VLAAREIASSTLSPMARRGTRVGPRRRLFTTFTILSAVFALAGVAYVLDGETGKGIPGIVVGIALIAVFEYLGWRYRNE